MTTACIVSGAAALVLLVLAFIATLPAMPGVLAGNHLPGRSPGAAGRGLRYRLRKHC